MALKPLCAEFYNHFLALTDELGVRTKILSTPERFYIVWPEKKYISDASNKASDIGGLIAFRGSFLRGYVRC